MSTRQEQQFLTSLRSLRNTLASAVDQMDLILDLAEQPVGEPSTSAACTHPVATRVPNPAMGHPDRFYCRKCKQEVEG